jgi:hypothetical protein
MNLQGEGILKKILLLLTAAVLILLGCMRDEPLSETAQIAQDYLEKKGYEVVSFENESWHQFSRSDLLVMPTQQIWAVQAVEPDPFLDKKIDTVEFLVKNHPFDDDYGEGKTNMTVYVFQGEVIGGWSFPYTESNDLGGAPFSIEGETAEEVHPDYYEWRQKWQDKYGN